MNWLFNVGDTDILRSATSAAAVFAYRAKRSKLRVAGAAAATLVVLVAVGGLLFTQGNGSWLAPLLSMLVIGWAGYCGWLTFKFLPSRNDRVVLGWRKLVREAVDPREPGVRALSDDELKQKTAEFRQRLAEGATVDEIRPEAYACIREASRRARNHRQFECQLIGGKVLEDCNVAEMRTGEGKTIVCYMANYMKVIQGLKVHMVTVNDYLVRRDAEFCRPIFELLGCSIGYITADMETWGPAAEIRRQSYACDITYGTNSEFGFDYLRDNMKHSARDQVQGPQDFVVVDEVDSILIDEARTPLIISGPAHDDVSNYRVANDIALSLIRKQETANRETRGRLAEIEADPGRYGLDGNEPKFKEGLKKFRADPFWLSSDEAEAIGHKQYFVVEADRKSAHMTEHGAKAAQQELGIGSFYDTKNMNWPHYIDNALRAHMVYKRDKEYVVQDDTIIIVDEFTGRLMHGRQWSDGLHQSVEAKERVTIKEETQTLATITLQNLFKLYKQLAGMTGTAMTEADEFMKIYKLEVIAIPTNRPVRRLDYNDKIYKNVGNKFDALVEEIRAYSQDGFPSDPWSLLDMLKHAERTLRELLYPHAAAGGLPPGPPEGRRPSRGTSRHGGGVRERRARRGRDAQRRGAAGNRAPAPGRARRTGEVQRRQGRRGCARRGVPAAHGGRAERRERPTRAGRHDQRRGLREAERSAPAAFRRRARSAERAARRRGPRIRDRRQSGPAARDGPRQKEVDRRQRDDRDEHGGPRHRHRARARRGGDRRTARCGHRAARIPPHRQPAPRPLRPPGRPRQLALFPLVR